MNEPPYLEGDDVDPETERADEDESRRTANGMVFLLLLCVAIILATGWLK